MKMKREIGLIALLALGGMLGNQAQATIVFSDGFQSGNLNNWANVGHGVLVPDPAGGGGYALTFTAVWAGGDIWSQPFAGGNYVSFEYYGRTVATGAGGFVGLNGSWFAGDIPYGGNSILLVNDNSWHFYQLQIPANGQLMLELFSGSASVPGNGFFKDIVVSTTPVAPVPEPSTYVAGIGALLGTLGLFRWKNRK